MWRELSPRHRGRRRPIARIPRLTLSGECVAASTNRIREYVDSTGRRAGDVSQRLAAAHAAGCTSFGRAAVRGDAASRSSARDALSEPVVPARTRRLALRAAGVVHRRRQRGVARARRTSIVVRGNNLTNSKKFGSGYASDGVVVLFRAAAAQFLCRVECVRTSRRHSAARGRPRKSDLGRSFPRMTA